MSNPKIMIVEDDGTIAVRLKRLMQEWGYDPIVTDSGKKALETAEIEQPELALMDIELKEPEMDGIVTALELRRRFDIPSIYLTAYADEELLTRAKKTEPYGYLVKPLQELTLRTTLDMALSKRSTDRQLEAALKEKEMLMREILHRTKNNMGSICSLIHLQSMRINDEKLLHVFKDITNRIESMLLIQEKLYRSKDLSSINLGEYIRDLGYKIFENLNIDSERIAIDFELEDVNVSTDSAIHCGLIINELMTNAIKYAFPDSQSGKISIMLNMDETGGAILRVSDNGTGLPVPYENLELNSLGLKLVEMIIQHQLKGTLEVLSEGGTLFNIRFRNGVLNKYQV